MNIKCSDAPLGLDHGFVSLDPVHRRRAQLEVVLKAECEYGVACRREDYSALRLEGSISRESAVSRLATLAQLCEEAAEDARRVYLSFARDIEAEFGPDALFPKLRAQVARLMWEDWASYGKPIIAAAPPSARVRLERSFREERNGILKAVCGPIECEAALRRGHFTRTFDHAPDFSWISVNGVRYTLGKGRRCIFSDLHSDWLKKGGGVGQDKLLTEAALKAGIRSLKMQNVWSGFPEFGRGKLIRQSHRATWTISPPGPCRCRAPFKS